MHTGNRVLLAGAIAAALVAAPGFARANCGAEGCPLDSHGPETLFGRFSMDVAYQYIQADRHWDGSHEISEDEAIAAEGGLGHILEQLTTTRSYNFNARARLTDRLMLSASVPYIDRVHRHALVHHAGYLIESEWHMRGMADASVLANWTALRASDHSLVLQLGVKLPTGQTNVEVVDGETPEPSARPGSGSTDALLGAQYVHRFTGRTFRGLSASIPVSLGVAARINGTGTEEYRMGNEWQAHMGASVPLVRRVLLLGQLNASAHARDDVGNTDAEPHNTGNTALYASPGLRAELTPGVAMFGYYQFRLYEHTNGPQLTAPYHLSLGMVYAFGM